jgi:CRP-like cAMP-binding protein
MTFMNPKHNEQLEQLMGSDCQMLYRELQLMSLEAGQNLFVPGNPFDYVYFPLNTLIAVSNEISDGVCIDIAVIGSEASAGLLGLFKHECPYRVYVAHPGLAYKIALPQLRQYFDIAGGCIQKMYVMANFHILTQIAAETTCAHFHTVPARLSKWLLRRTELVDQTYLEVTHQYISESLGVRREGITNALAKLAGISSHRNRIEVIDRSALQQEVCDCYHSINENSHGQKTLQFQKN